jgi:predicted Rossmann fold nucleotide-binding protein DprA/Smf involved in DNA uptake
MAGFNVDNAMQRNKLIYALADAALVISSDYQKGGMWTGAAEQLTTLRLVPVFVRSQGEIDKGLQELQNMGALPWPNPSNAEDLVRTLRPEQDPTTHNEEQALAPVHESIPEPPATTKTKPAPAKRRSKPRKSAGDISEPTLFDAAPAAIVRNKQTTTPHKRSKGTTDTEEGGANHANN